MSEKTPGEVLFHAVNSVLLSRGWEPTDTWDELTPDERAALEHGAKAVRNLPAPHGTIGTREWRWCDMCGGVGERGRHDLECFECEACEGLGRIPA